jgi:hypothetical protein
MKDFVHNGFYAPTMTTTDDPNLKVQEVDNGISWNMYFTLEFKKNIDKINMERPGRLEIHPQVLKLRVLDVEGNDIGSVEERYQYAQQLDEGFDQIMLNAAIGW